jgi:hypothetical protein
MEQTSKNQAQAVPNSAFNSSKWIFKDVREVVVVALAYFNS